MSSLGDLFCISPALICSSFAPHLFLIVITSVPRLSFSFDFITNSVCYPCVCLIILGNCQGVTVVLFLADEAILKRWAVLKDFGGSLIKAFLWFEELRFTGRQ